MTAPNEGAPRAGVEAGTEAQREQKHPDSATAAEVQTAERKRFERLRALLALKGHELYATADGFTVRRWGLTKELTGLDEAEAFARHVGANV